MIIFLVVPLFRRRDRLSHLQRRLQILILVVELNTLFGDHDLLLRFSLLFLNTRALLVHR